MVSILFKWGLAGLGFLSLSGCVAATMAANLAASEVATSAMDLGVEVTGNDVWNMAEWDKQTTKKTVGIFGNTDWDCARGQPGRTVCVPQSVGTFEKDDIFKCEMGTGGIVETAFSGNASVLFCVPG